MKNAMKWFLVLGALLFALLSVIGAVNNFSPVPYWDMWDGYILFYTRIMNDDYSAWWGLHVNHRPIFSNLLFYIDHFYFHGNIWFLILMNYVLLSFIFLNFVLILRKGIYDNHSNDFKYLGYSFIGILLFSWIQEENLNWGFQSAMYATQLFPMASFFLIFCSSKSSNYKNLFFTASIITGILSSATMMNGILVLPMMTVLIVFYRLGKNKAIIASFISLIIFAAYFSNYSSPVGQGDFVNTMLNQPVEVSKFFLMLLGSPIFYMTGSGSQVGALVSGFILLLLLGISIFKIFYDKKHREIELVLIFILLYCFASALGIASGRLIHGIEQAFTSRYMTSVMVMWSALFALLMILFQTRLKRSGLFVFILIVLMLALVPQQIKVFNDKQNYRFQKIVAALAFEMKVRDQNQVNYIFPWVDIGFELANDAIINNYSIFSNPLIKDASDLIGSIHINNELLACQGQVIKSNQIETEERFYRVDGIIINDGSIDYPEALLIIDNNNVVVGYAVTDYSIHSVFKKQKESNNIFFVGYVLVGNHFDTLTFKGRQSECQF